MNTSEELKKLLSKKRILDNKLMEIRNGLTNKTFLVNGGNIKLTSDYVMHKNNDSTDLQNIDRTQMSFNVAMNNSVQRIQRFI